MSYENKSRFFYGWIITVAGLIIGTVIFGTRYSFGVFFTSIESEFNLSRAETSTIFSAYMLFAPLFATLGGWALDKYGPKFTSILTGVFTCLGLILTSRVTASWQLYLTYSLLLAIGTGATYTILMSTISRWFNRKRGLALGIGGAGGGLGTVFMAPLAVYLITTFDWRMAFLIMGFIAGLVVITLSLLLKKDPGGSGLSPDGTSDIIVTKDIKAYIKPVNLSLIQAFKTRNFWALSVVWFSFSVCLHLLMTHLVPHITDLAISATEAAIILGLTGAMSIPGRLIVGWISDRIGRQVSSIFCALIQCAAMVWLAFAQDVWMFYIFAVTYGFAYGGFDSPVTAMIGDIFGLRNIGIIIGMLGISYGIGAAVGPAVAGLLFDITQSYFIAFLMGAIVMLLTAFSVVFIKLETSSKIGEILAISDD